MTVYRQFSDDAGQSHLEPLGEARLQELSAWTEAKAFRFHTHAPGTFLDWHPASGSFLIVVLSGQLEITVSDGASLLCGPGTLRLTADRGRGHTGRVIGDEPCTVLMLDAGDAFRV